MDNKRARRRTRKADTEEEPRLRVRPTDAPEARGEADPADIEPDIDSDAATDVDQRQHPAAPADDPIPVTDPIPDDDRATWNDWDEDDRA